MAINYALIATSTLSFTAALAWNDALSKMINSLFPPRHERDASYALMLYAIIVTLLIFALASGINQTHKLVSRLAPNTTTQTIAP